jgi:hypothetical protein
MLHYGVVLQILEVIAGAHLNQSQSAAAFQVDSDVGTYDTKACCAAAEDSAASSASDTVDSAEESKLFKLERSIAEHCYRNACIMFQLALD